MDRRCLVCHSEKNVRKNFGVFSCVSCRIFFSRNTGKDLVCLQNRSCRIEGESRKSCAFCRFKKCLDCGMRKKRFSSTKTARNHWKAKRIMRKQEESYVELDSISAMVSSPTSSSTITSSYDQLTQSIRLQTQSPEFMNYQVRISELSVFFLEPFAAEYTNLFSTSCQIDSMRGLELTECVLRKNLSLIKLLPMMHDLEHSLLARMLKEKIFGLLIIYSAILYDNSKDSFTTRVSVSTPPSNSSSDGPITQQNSVMTFTHTLKDFIGSILSSLYQSAASQGCTSVCNMLQAGENGQIYASMERFLKNFHDIFTNDVHLAVPAFMGFYLLIPVYSQVNCSETILRSKQMFYQTYLNNLLMTRNSDYNEFVYAQDRWLMLSSEVRHLELCHQFIGRLLPMDHLTPLMKEIFDS